MAQQELQEQRVATGRTGLNTLTNVDTGILGDPNCPNGGQFISHWDLTLIQIMFCLLPKFSISIIYAMDPWTSRCYRIRREQDGADGINGIDGQDGQDGATGATGQEALTGQDGQDGADGSHGTRWTDGQDGATGATGADGSPQVQQGSGSKRTLPT